MQLIRIVPPCHRAAKVLAKFALKFAPTTTWGLPDGIGKFNGQLYVEATVPLKVADLPLQLKGSMVLDIDPDGEPIRGQLSVLDRGRRPFFGWLELVGAVEAARHPARGR